MTAWSALLTSRSCSKSPSLGYTNAHAVEELSACPISNSANTSVFLKRKYWSGFTNRGGISLPRAYTTFTLVPDAEPKLGGSFEGEKMTRRRFQRGSIYKRGKRKVWVARFFEDVIAPDGAVKRIRRSETLGSITEIPTRRQAEQVLQDRLRLFNSSEYRPSSSCTLREYAENRWLPEVLPTLKHSTKKHYQYILRVHVYPAIGDMQLRL